MKIAIDFGTSYTKIAYLNERGEPTAFQFGPNRETYIPTALAYQQDRDLPDRQIGSSARLRFLNEPDIAFCENYKMLLPMSDATQWRAQGWSVKEKPDTITAAYFRTLLRDHDHAFERQVGKIDSLVVSVPEVWQSTPSNRGAEAVRRIFREDLRLPLSHVQSEPVCAAAYYAWRYEHGERRPIHGNLLMCDVGGGTFDMALCRIGGGQITVLDFDGNGDSGMGSAGVAFDRNAVRLAWRAHHKAEPDLQNVEFIEALRAFEQVKWEQAERIQRRLAQAPIDEFEKAQPIYSFLRRYHLHYDQIIEAFQPIREAIQAVITRIIARAKQNGHTIDRLAIVGGFGQFPLVEDAILQAVGIKDRDADPRFDSLMHGKNEWEQRKLAIAFGAALIGGEVVRPVERYPHSVGIQAYREADGTRVYVPIIHANSDQNHETVTYATNGQQNPRVFRFEANVTRLPIIVKQRGSGQWQEAVIAQHTAPPPGEYHIGLQVDRSNLASAVLRPVGGGSNIVYHLGALRFSN